ncbi:MAG: hypothetical protein ABSB15_06745 [Bryobacteraceae bacterium]|jgi:hypothetical protein
MKPHEDPELEHLRDEIHQLERRVEALEHSGVAHLEPASLIGAEVFAGAPALGLPNAVPIAGKAVLGLAGAYLLRALAESGAVPALLVVAVAILYAATWLFFSVRTHEDDAFAGSTYGITAALILAPLLWEATVRFNVLPPAATAGILIAFIVLVSALTWSRNPGIVTAVTTLSTILLALALMLRTGDVVPFAAAILVIACVVEVGACHGAGNKMRVPVALAADFAVWLLLYLLSRHGGLPQDYKPIASAASLLLCAAFFLIYAISIPWRAVILHRTLSIFEIAQCAAAFALATEGALQITQGEAAPSIGALSAIAGAACYFTAFIRFADRGVPEKWQRRNHHVFAAWGAALCLVACALILPASLLTPIWSVAAVIATLAGARAHQPTLGIHGAVYLLAAGLAAGLPTIALNAFTGAPLEPVTPSLWIMTIASVCCYAAWGNKPARVSLVSALLAGVSLGALLILTSLPLLFGQPTVSVLATARTLVTCALALAFSFAGSRSGRRELVWIGYTAIALGTVKLLLEDFRQSHPAALAISLVCYGAMLIALPKLAGKSACATKGS